MYDTCHYNKNKIIISGSILTQVLVGDFIASLAQASNILDVFIYTPNSLLPPPILLGNGVPSLTPVISDT